MDVCLIVRSVHNIIFIYISESLAKQKTRSDCTKQTIYDLTHNAQVWCIDILLRPTYTIDSTKCIFRPYSK